MSPFLRIAIRTAYSAGKILLRYSKRRNKLIVWENEVGKLLCNAGLECEEEIITQLKSSYPQHSIISESTQIKKRSSEYQWMVNALEGIDNFICGIPNFIISLGLKYKNEVQVGMVYDPLRDEIFITEKNAGASLNQIRMRVTEKQKIDVPVIGMHLTDTNYKRHYFKYLESLIKNGLNIKQLGVPSLGLCYVACGRYNGFWQSGRFYCDDTALLIANEAGNIAHYIKAYDATIIGNQYFIDRLIKLRLG